jgi:uncharacterized protein YbjT (DUF2867 family)
VVIDVSNSPSFEDEAVMEFFVTSTTNLLAAEADAGVRRHVALSAVGAERLSESGYLRAKVGQEKLISYSSIPFSMVHATQFFEFAMQIADDAMDGDRVRLPHVLLQRCARAASRFSSKAATSLGLERRAARPLKADPVPDEGGPRSAGPGDGASRSPVSNDPR